MSAMQKPQQIHPPKSRMALYLLWFFAINNHAACLQFLLLSLSLLAFLAVWVIYFVCQMTCELNQTEYEAMQTGSEVKRSGYE
jgi:hypothetical protein